MAYDNTNRGTIAKNTRKSKETDADITGSINIDGREFWLNGWQKTNGQDGSKFYSLSVKPKVARTEAPAPPASQPYGDKSRRQVPVFDPVAASMDDADDIPF